jgi:hypothetical protein
MAQQDHGPKRGPAPVGRWIRSHLAVVGGTVAALAVVVIIVIAVALSGSSGGGRAVPAGSIVGSGPLTSGYRITGKVLKATPTTLLVRIASVDYSAGEARNVVLRPDAEIEFVRPADGTVALARNGHEITSTAGIHNGDTVVLVGQFTSVVGAPGPAHQGYAYIGVEASAM